MTGKERTTEKIVAPSPEQVMDFFDEARENPDELLKFGLSAEFIHSFKERQHRHKITEGDWRLITQKFFDGVDDEQLRSVEVGLGTMLCMGEERPHFAWGLVREEIHRRIRMGK